MWYYVESIARSYADASKKRGDFKRFRYGAFIRFARKNREAYRLIDEGHGLMVSTWFFSDLIQDYRETIPIKR